MQRIFKHLIWLVIFSQLAECMHVLLLGDSFDKHSTSEYCSLVHHSSDHWTDPKLGYIGSLPGGARCHIGKDKNTISMLRIFGSNMTGPYFHDNILSKDPNLQNSSIRIKYGLEMYFRKFSLPDVLFFHTSMWDYYFIQHHYQQLNKADSNPLQIQLHLQQIEINYRHHIREIESIIAAYNEKMAGNLKKRVVVALRTAPYVTSRSSAILCHDSGHPMLTSYNLFTRRIAKEMKLALHDYDRDVWSSVAGDTHRCDILRDHVHVSDFYAISRAKKLLNVQHSNYIFIPSEYSQDKTSNSSSFQTSWFQTANDSSTILNIVKKVYITTSAPYNASLYDAIDNPGYVNGTDAYLDDLCANNKIWFISYTTENSTWIVRRHSGVTKAFLQFMRLGRGDLYHASAWEIAQTKVSYDVPTMFNADELNKLSDIWRKTFLVAFPTTSTENAGMLKMPSYPRFLNASDLKPFRDNYNITTVHYFLITDVHKHRVLWQRYQAQPPLERHDVNSSLVTQVDSIHVKQSKFFKSSEWKKLQQADRQELLFIDIHFFEFLPFGRDITIA